MQSKSTSSSSVSHRLSIIIVTEVGTIRIDFRRIVVAAQNNYWSVPQRTTERVFVRVNIVGITSKWTACVGLLVGNLFALLAHKVVPFVTNAAIRIYIIGGVLGTSIADPIYSHEPSLAKAAAAKIILVEATLGWNQKTARLVGRAVNFIACTLSTVSIN